jgi:uncharacterized membrane protein YdbT with pleckstrin-like domain
MSYINDSLSDGEEIINTFSLHWITWFPVIVLYVLIITIPVAIGKHLMLRSREQGLTNRRVIFKTGLLRRDTAEMPLGSIETVTIHQTMWGRLMGYGTVKITGRGISDVSLLDIDDPMMVKKAIESAKYNPA